LHTIERAHCCAADDANERQSSSETGNAGPENEEPNYSGGKMQGFVIYVETWTCYRAQNPVAAVRNLLLKSGSG